MFGAAIPTAGCKIIDSIFLRLAELLLDAIVVVDVLRVFVAGGEVRGAGQGVLLRFVFYGDPFEMRFVEEKLLGHIDLGGQGLAWRKAVLINSVAELARKGHEWEDVFR